MKEDLKNEILRKQGTLLYTTLSEECAELIQACSKIIRKKFYEEDISKVEYNNLLEEIGDVEMNIELIKHQISKDYMGNKSVSEDILLGTKALIEYSKKQKEDKLREKFLPDDKIQYKVKYCGKWVPVAYNDEKQCFELVEDEQL